MLKNLTYLLEKITEKLRMNGMFTDRVKKVMQLAREASVRFGNDYVGTEHLLLGLIHEGEGVAIVVLKNLGVELEELSKNIEFHY